MATGPRARKRGRLATVVAGLAVAFAPIAVGTGAAADSVLHLGGPGPAGGSGNLSLTVRTDGRSGPAVLDYAVRAGDPLSRTYVLTAVGEADVTDITVADDEIPGSAISCRDGGPHVAFLRALTSVTCTAQVPAAAGLRVGTVRAIGHVAYPDRIGTTAAAVTAGYFGLVGGLTVRETLAGGQTELPVGGSAGIRYEITDVGNVPLYDVTLADSLVPGGCDPGVLEPAQTGVCLASFQPRLGEHHGTVRVTASDRRALVDAAGTVRRDPPVVGVGQGYYVGIEAAVPGWVGRVPTGGPPRSAPPSSLTYPDVSSPGVSPLFPGLPAVGASQPSFPAGPPPGQTVGLGATPLSSEPESGPGVEPGGSRAEPGEPGSRSSFGSGSLALRRRNHRHLLMRMILLVVLVPAAVGSQLGDPGRDSRCAQE